MDNLVNIAVDVNGVSYERARRAAFAFERFYTHRARSDRHTRRLRARRLWSLHDPFRWTTGALMLDVCCASARAYNPDGRRVGDDRGPTSAAASLPRCSWSAMRLLHAWISDDPDPIPGGQPKSKRRRDPRRHLRQPLPLYRLPAYC